MATYLGIDLGTSSTKVVLATQDGRVLARSSAPSTTRRHGSDGATQSPAEWETSLMAALAGLPDHLLVDVDGVAVDGHVPSLVPVDADGQPLHECLTWQDNRPQQQTTRLERDLGDLTEHVGIPLPWSPSQLPAKAAWLAEHVDVGKVAALLSPKDLLNHRLTGELATDAWTSKGLVDVRNRTAATTVLHAAG